VIVTDGEVHWIKHDMYSLLHGVWVTLT